MVTRVFMPEEACDFLRIGKTTLYRLINTGKLECFRVGGRGRGAGDIRISLEQIEKFLESTREDDDDAEEGS